MFLGLFVWLWFLDNTHTHSNITVNRKKVKKIKRINHLFLLLNVTVFVWNSIHLMWVKLALHIYSYVEFLEVWCLKVVPSHICVTGLNSEFSFSKTICYTKVKELSLSYLLLITEERIGGYIPFPRVLAWRETQTAFPRIWTKVTESISYNDYHYTLSISVMLQWWDMLMISHFLLDMFNELLIILMSLEHII